MGRACASDPVVLADTVMLYATDIGDVIRTARNNSGLKTRLCSAAAMLLALHHSIGEH